MNYIEQERLTKTIADCVAKGLIVAGCIRVSKDKFEQEYSVEMQNNRLEQLQKEFNIPASLYTTFFDEISGFKTEKRKEFLEMIELCKKGKVGIIITVRMDRFMRNAKDFLNHIDLLHNELKIPIYALDKGFDKYDLADDKFTTQLTDGLLPEYFRNKVKDSTKSVLLRKAERGEWIGAVPFAYNDKNKYASILINGKRQKKPAELVIDENKAEIVRLIYKDILNKDFSYSKTSAKYGITISVLKGIVNNIKKKIYHGYIMFSFDGKSLSFKGLHPPILS